MNNDHDDVLDLSVVIAAHNAERTLCEQLTALMAQEWDGAWEVVVADNASTDGTRSVIASFQPRVRVVDARARRGAGYARNVGVSVARGTAIAFCDADDVVGEGWLAAVGDALRINAFVTGPQEYETLNPPWMHGAYGTRTASELQSFFGIFPFGPTANLGIRRQLFDDIGGFDDTFLTGQDVELCLRAWLAGARLEFVPEAVVHYRYRTEISALWRRARDYGAVAPAIARKLAEAGAPVPSPLRGLRNWIWLLRRLPSLRSRSGRARWIVVAGGSVGRLVGSLRSRHVML